MELAADAASTSIGIETLIVLMMLFVVGRVRRRVHHARPAADSHAKREARPRPAGVWRQPPIPAAADQSIGRDADHFRQQLADAAVAVVRIAGQRGWRAEPGNVLDWVSLHLGNLQAIFSRGTSFIYNLCTSA